MKYVCQNCGKEFCGINDKCPKKCDCGWTMFSVTGLDELHRITRRNACCFAVIAVGGIFLWVWIVLIIVDKLS